MTLVIQPLPGIGDMVWHAAHVRALAAMEPSGKVTLLTKRRSCADRLFAGEDILHDVLWLERNPGRHDGIPGMVRLASMLRPHGFRRMVVLHKDPYYGGAGLLAGIPQRQGYGLKWPRPALTGGPFLPPAMRRATAIERADAFLAALGWEGDLTPRLVVGADAAAEAARLLPEDDRPAVALGIGASEETKRWPLDHYARLARALAARGWRTVVLAGGPGDTGTRPVLEAALAASGVRLTDTFALGIDRAMAVIARCGLFVGNDSGALNMAAALGVPSVGLFGPTRALSYTANLLPVVAGEGGAPGAIAGLPLDRVMAAVEELTGSGHDRVYGAPATVT